MDPLRWPVWAPRSLRSWQWSSSREWTRAYSWDQGTLLPTWNRTPSSSWWRPVRARTWALLEPFRLLIH